MSVPAPSPNSTSAFSGHDRRRSERFDALGQLNVHVSSRPMSVAVREVSAGGFSIETTEPIAVGVVHRFQFYFEDDGASVAADARCVHTMRVSGSIRLPIYLSGFEFGANEIKRNDRLAALLSDIASLGELPVE